MAILVENSTNIAIMEHSHRKMSLFGIFKTQHGRDKSLQQWFCLLKIYKSEEITQRYIFYLYISVRNNRSKECSWLGLQCNFRWLYSFLQYFY